MTDSSIYAVFSLESRMLNVVDLAEGKTLVLDFLPTTVTPLQALNMAGFEIDSDRCRLIFPGDSFNATTDHLAAYVRPIVTTQSAKGRPTDEAQPDIERTNGFHELHDPKGRLTHAPRHDRDLVLAMTRFASAAMTAQAKNEPPTWEELTQHAIEALESMNLIDKKGTN